MSAMTIERATGTDDSTVSDPAPESMHGRLTIWGRLFCCEGGGPRQRWDSDDEREYLPITPRERDDASHLHTLICQLPKPQQRFTLQVFYADYNLAMEWDRQSWHMKQTVILPGLARAINGDIRRHNARLPEWERFPMVRPDEIDGIRHRAIRALVNREAIARERGIVWLR